MPVINDTTSVNASSNTLQSMVDECRDSYLYGGSTPQLNQLAAGCGSTDTSLSFLNAVGSMSTPGQRIAIDYEEMRVWASSGNNATSVERGVSSSGAAIHAQGALVEVAPRFSQYRVAKAINEDIASLTGEGLFAVNTLEFNYNPAVMAYDLGSIAWDDILDVRYEIPGPTKNWKPIRKFAKLRNADTTQFPSGNAIVLYETAFPGLPVRIRYRGAFTQLVNATDDPVAVGGLPATAVDIPILGAAIRLMAGQETVRASLVAQRDPMIQESVPPGTALNSVKNLMALRQQRLVSEAARLARQYPKVAPQ